MSLRNIGLRTDNFKAGVLPYGLFTFVGVICLSVLAFMLNKQPLSLWWSNPHQQGIFIIVSFIQEFVFRSVIQNKLQNFFSPSKTIIFVAILFSSMHVFWQDPLILTLAFVAGLGWGYLWWKYPNLYLITLSHAILNFLIVYFGFFPWLVTDLFR